MNKPPAQCIDLTHAVNRCVILNSRDSNLIAYIFPSGEYLDAPGRIFTFVLIYLPYLLVVILLKYTHFILANISS